ncbi:uncharacterized protein STEHIDRAFT_141042 [Stereum hirsutum FP-91666 SS1]|uniref:uncharacterized protein n=1 Tax=Stereum hirsutum (strain FP-91666) TaxID=721885 RepID=UPI0004449A0B|nr:uncharacterized protein STEHIDRAFT_141042 [Stereum hirsutum FP-91666 SS1]EIM83186.1 hypothetical protein STEHIDRAFT_141042 [Stereum hirsutum FP-91666 SS1]
MEGVDVGRPDYPTLLMRAFTPLVGRIFMADTPTFEAIENGAFPTLHLLAGVPNVVYACLPRLANILRFPWSPEGSAYTRRAMELAIYLTELWEWELGDVEPARSKGLPPLGTNSDTSPMAVPSSSLMASDAPFGDKGLDSQIVSDLAMISYCMDEDSPSGSRSHTRLSAQALRQIDCKPPSSPHLESDKRSVTPAAQPAQSESRLTCSSSDPPPNKHTCDNDKAKTNASISSWLERLLAEALPVSPTDVFDEMTEVTQPGNTDGLTSDDIDTYESIEIEQGVPFEAVLFWTAKPGPGRADVLWRLADGV